MKVQQSNSCPGGLVFSPEQADVGSEATVLGEHHSLNPRYIIPWVKEQYFSVLTQSFVHLTTSNLRNQSMKSLWFQQILSLFWPKKKKKPTKSILTVYRHEPNRNIRLISLPVGKQALKHMRPSVYAIFSELHWQLLHVCAPGEISACVANARSLTLLSANSRILC